MNSIMTNSVRRAAWWVARRTLLFSLSLLAATVAMAQPAPYTWTTMSRNASESMPCGGGDVGMNVWVEGGDILFYLSRSGSFDENNTLLKLGRFRIRMPQPWDTASFRQQLVLADGYCEISDSRQSVTLWADVWKPVVHVEIRQSAAASAEIAYESWRTSDTPLGKRSRFQTSYKFAAPKGQVTRRDSILAEKDGITFFHHNGEQTVFDATVHQQQMDAVKERLYNPLRMLTFGGRMTGIGLTLKGHSSGRYASTGYEQWTYATPKGRQQHVSIVMAARQGTVGEWQGLLQQTARRIQVKRDRTASQQWWRAFWQRSYVEGNAPWLRNYSLFRYMLGCNSHSEWPTKFNGGLFTFDPEYVMPTDEYRLSPDFRNWGGGVHTAQNQRLVYWPMLKSGDYDLLKAQLDFYLRIYQNAEERSRCYWHHEGACLTEQIENYGLPCYPEYGTKRPAGFDPGMERNAWLEYEWDTCLEFCQMALEAHRYSGIDIEEYVPMIRSCLRFFDEHYQYLARQRGAKTLDGQGKLVLYPGSGCETIKGAYNSTSTIAALRTVTTSLIDYLGGDSLLSAFMQRLPDITLHNGMIAPAIHYERIQNIETPHLYPVFPWRIYGVGRNDIDVARRTYSNDSLAIKFRSHIGWKQDAIWAACLGLTDEAYRLTAMKMADGLHRFPAFWGPGYDWTPDHNWGGSGMIATQEMLLQEANGKIYLFPAWPLTHDVHFRLHVSGGTTVEAELKKGRIVSIKVTPTLRKCDIVMPNTTD